jgi:ABC-type glycerol-3-phosphate transport system substrate-binding protein
MLNRKKVTLLSGLIVLSLSASVRAEDVVPETQIIEKMLPDFEKQYHIKVQFEKIGYGDMHDKLVSQLIQSQSYYNLLEVDFLWAGEFSKAGWLTDLTPDVKKSNFDMSAFIPATVSLINVTANKTSLIPMYNYSMGLIYRTDVLQDEKLKSAYQTEFKKPLEQPKTLEEYVSLAKFIKKNSDMSGAAMQGQRGDPNSMEFSNYLFASGGAYIDDKGKSALNSPAGNKAMTLYADAIKNAAQTGALSATLDDTVRLMCSGKAFSMLTYWWMLPQLDNATTCPAVAGKLALTTVPGGHGESGGWGWGIPKNVSDKEKQAAWTFIQWVQSKEVTTARALQGHAPVRADAYENAEVLKKYPYYKDALNIVASGKSFPVFSYSAQYEDVLGTQLSLLASGENTVDKSLKSASDQLDKLLVK